MRCGQGGADALYSGVVKNALTTAVWMCTVGATAGCGQIVTETEPGDGACPGADLDVAFGGADSQVYIEGLSVAVDGKCNWVIAGGARGKLDFGGGDVAVDGQTQAFVAKLDPEGGHLWSVGLSGVRLSGKRVIAVDGEDGVFVGGATFDGPMTAEYDNADEVTLIKIDADGKESWRKVMTGNAPADVGFQGGFRRNVTGVGLGSDGGVVIGGDFIGETDFGGVTLASKPLVMDPYPTDYKPDVFVAGYDAGGELLWARGFGGDDYDRHVGLDTTPGGDTVLVFSHSPDSMNPDDSAGLEFVKLAPDGGTVWSKSMVESWTIHGGPSVVATETGGMVVGGTGDLSLSPFCECSPAFAARFGADGEPDIGVPLGDAPEWPPSVVVSSVIPDGENGMLAVGGFADTLLVHGKAMAESSGGFDAFEAHVEEDFDALAASSWGGAADELAVAIARTPDGGRVIAGVEGPMFQEQGESALWTGGARLFVRRR
jgi:hypothetical protein